jgi:hypothetical protein
VIRRCEFDRALALVHRSGVHTQLEAILRPDGRGGRPRRLGVDVFLAGLICTVGTKKTLALTNVHELLTRDLARSYQTALRIREGFQAVTIRQVRYLLEAIEKKLAFTEDRAPALTAVDRAERQEALQNIYDRLLAATMAEHLPTTGAYALDDSGIDSAARGKRRRPTAATDPAASENDGEVTDTDIAEIAEETGTSFDPDARWGYRTRTYDNRTNKLFGYKLVSLTRLAPVGSKTDLPMLVERIAFIPANASPVGPALDAIDRLRAEGKAVTEIADDRGFSYALAENWAYKLRDRGIEQVLDLHHNDRGVRDFDGVKMIDGTPHCPATPEHLEVIIRPAQLSVPVLKANATAVERAEHTEKQKALDEFQALIAERETWAFRRVEGPDQTGKERYECPAQAGKRRCEHCPISQFLPAGTPTVENPPAAGTAPAACSQRTITVPGDVTPKIRQRLYWGGPKWIAAYNRRSRVEAGFGNIKSSKNEDVRRGWIHVVGLVKTGLMVVVAQAAANLRCLRTWAERTGDRTDRLSWADPEDHGFEEIEPGGANPATGPPQAA